MIPTRVMGVVNATPDSFSDGGRFLDEAAAVSHGLRLLDAGAAILDVGGESTRPNSDPVSEDEELARVTPVIAAIKAVRPQAVISIDTMKPAVARGAVKAGASIWNDVAALGWAPEGLDTAAELGCEVVLMHMKGEPKTMQAAPHYDDVVAEVRDFLHERTEAAMRAGVARERIWLDPGLGFGKTLDHNLALLRALPELKALGYPLLVGASRKAMIGRLDPLGAGPDERLGGSVAVALWSAANGADVVRVHDVRETAQALAVWGAMAGPREA